MNRLTTCTCLALALLICLPGSADDAASLRTGRAWALAHESLEAWSSSSAEQESTTIAALRLDLFAFAGAARLAAERFSAPGLSGAEARLLVSSLEDLAGSCQNAMDRARVGTAVRTAWAEARSALAALVDGAATSGSGGTSGSGRVINPEPESATPAREPEPPADPNAPRAVISETRWSGTFTPDLVVSGRVEGRGMRSGSLVLRDSSGREVHRSDKEINDSIAAATSGSAKDALATATFSVRIDDDKLATGENVIVLTVTDSRGRTAESKTSVTKRLF